ncbi:MAG: SufD family Fe-S cluster assembly protein [Anaerolineales bacterium]|nr:SufD family Fe-S cluster assembly protein [Anaerolineales bacterium]
MARRSERACEKGDPAAAKPPSLTDIQVEAIGRETGEPGWMVDLRRAAFESYRRMEMPSPAADAWRRTDLLHFPYSELNLEALAVSGKPKRVPASWLKPVAGVRTGGQLALEDRSVHTADLHEDLARAGVIFMPFSQAVREHPDLVRRLMGSVIPPTADIFAALISILFDSGFLLHVPKGVRIEKPLHSLLWSSGEGLRAWRLLVNVEEGAEVSLLHEVASPERAAAAARLDIVELIVHPGATLRFVMTQAWGGNIVRVAHEKAAVHQGGRLFWGNAEYGARSTKVFSTLDLKGEGASAQWSRIQVLDGEQRADITTSQKHLAPRTVSDLLSKAVLLGGSESNASGMIRIEPEAAGADGYQGNRILILSERAKAEAVPGLEILSDDVRCSHEVSIGGLDPDELFYLRSRGIPEEESKTLLVEGFLEGVLARIPDEEIRRRMHLAASAKMKTMDAGQLPHTQFIRKQAMPDAEGAQL